MINRRLRAQNTVPRDPAIEQPVDMARGGAAGALASQPQSRRKAPIEPAPRPRRARDALDDARRTRLPRGSQRSRPRATASPTAWISTKQLASSPRNHPSHHLDRRPGARHHRCTVASDGGRKARLRARRRHQATSGCSPSPRGEADVDDPAACATIGLLVPNHGVQRPGLVDEDTRARPRGPTPRVEWRTRRDDQADFAEHHSLEIARVDRHPPRLPPSRDGGGARA